MTAGETVGKASPTSSGEALQTGVVMGIRKQIRRAWLGVLIRRTEIELDDAIMMTRVASTQAELLHLHMRKETIRRNLAALRAERDSLMPVGQRRIYEVA